MRHARRIIYYGSILATVSISSWVSAATLPNDPYYSYQTALATAVPVEASISRAWDITTDASQVIVAVIDTGVDLEHPDLRDNLWINSGEVESNGIDDDGNGYVDDVNGYDFRHYDGTPEDEWGHGTLISGIIGAQGDNELGSAGVAWHVQLMELKVFGASGGARMDDYVGAIRYAVANGANIINASWIIPPQLGDPELESLKEAVQEAEAAGVLVVAAAGNDGDDLDQNPVYPAAYAETIDNVISVAGLDYETGELLAESNYGAHTVTLATIGKDVVGTYLNDSYATLTGTSAAAAIVSGVASLIMSQNLDLHPDEVKSFMTSHGVSVEGLSQKLISGMELNAKASLVSVSGTEEGTDQSGGGTIAGTVEVSSTGGGAISSQAASAGCSLIPE